MVSTTAVDPTSDLHNRQTPEVLRENILQRALPVHLVSQFWRFDFDTSEIRSAALQVRAAATVKGTGTAIDCIAAVTFNWTKTDKLSAPSEYGINMISELDALEGKGRKRT